MRRSARRRARGAEHYGGVLGAFRELARRGPGGPAIPTLPQSLPGELPQDLERLELPYALPDERWAREEPGSPRF